MPNLGDVFPDFTADTNKGPIQFHKAIDNSWAILFSHPADYTPVCTTELGEVLRFCNNGEFAKRKCKVFALSCDSAESHCGWQKDVQAHSGLTGDFPYHIIADEKRELAVKLGMVDPDEKDGAGMPLTCRAVFIIGPDKKLKLSILYPATTGRNFNEILRVLDSLQLTSIKKVATPVNWTPGKECMVVPSVSDEDAATLFPKHRKVTVPSGKGYLRFTPVDYQAGDGQLKQ